MSLPLATKETDESPWPGTALAAVNHAHEQGLEIALGVDCCARTNGRIESREDGERTGARDR